MGCRNLRRTCMEGERRTGPAVQATYVGAVGATSRHAPGFTEPFQALEFHEFRGGGPQIVAVKEWLEGAGPICGQGAEFGIGARFVEEGNGLALAAPAPQRRSREC